MKSLKRVIAVAAVAAGMVAGAASAAFAEYRFIYVSHGQANDSFHSVVKNAAMKAAQDLGVKLEYRSPETFDMVAMSQLIDAAVNQDPDGLIVTIPDGDALGPSIQRAVEAGIPVISTNSGSDVSRKLGALIHIGQEEYTAGLEAGRKLKELGGKKGICVHVEPGNVALDQRCQGFSDGFGGNVSVLPTSLDIPENVAKIRAALDSDPDIDTILGTSAPHAGESAVKAVEEAGREGQVHVATFDLSAQMLQYIVDGKAEFAIDQQQYLYGYLPVVLLKLYNDYGLMPAANIASGPKLVTQKDAAQVIELSAQGIR